MTGSPDHLIPMTHSRLVDAAVNWLHCQYRCGIVLSEQSCASGETPDAIGWKGKNHSVVVECKISRADFFADASKAWRVHPESALGCERFYLASARMISCDELPCGWGLLEIRGRDIQMVHRSKKNLRGAGGLANEMNLLLASLRRVEVRIEPQTITDFLKWKNRMARYNGGGLPLGIASDHEERNGYLA
ncbi:MAG TPA: MmcB family DNA repair protein [Terriglobales bacterium]|nr:MmcB family DNA repair protein [Terriglobales bacterium]